MHFPHVLPSDASDAIRLSLGIGSAYADSEGGQVANTQFTELPGVIAQAPVQSAPAVATAQSGQVVHARNARGNGGFRRSIKAVAAVGLYQVFLEGGPGSGMLLGRAYARAAGPASLDCEVLPFVGSRLSRWDARYEGSSPGQPKRRASDTLTARARDVLAMIGRGFANKRITRTLEISAETVKSHEVAWLGAEMLCGGPK